MTNKTTLVKIFTVDWERLKKIKEKHGFPNYAETAGYVLQKFPEMIVKSPEKSILSNHHIIPGNLASLQIVTNVLKEDRKHDQ